MFLNTISRKSTEYPFRFKTKNEFENEYGFGWRTNIIEFGSEYNWVAEMDDFFGEDFDINLDKETIIERMKSYGSMSYNQMFYISLVMLVENKPFNTVYNNKKELVYEKRNIDNYKYVIMSIPDKEVTFTNIQNILIDNGFKPLFGRKYTLNDTLNSDDNHIIIDIHENDYCTYSENTVKLIGLDGMKFILNANELKSLFTDKPYLYSMYNQKKELVYEKKKIDNFDVIIMKLPTDDESFKELQKFLFDNNYEWALYGYNTKDLSYVTTNNENFIIIDNGDNDFATFNQLVVDESIIDIEKHGYKFKIIENLDELKLLFIDNPNVLNMYNKKKELIYEKKKIDNYGYVIFKMPTDETTIINFQNLLFKNGFHWFMDDDNELYDITICQDFDYIVIDNYDKDISMVSYNFVGCYTNSDDSISIDDFNTLKSMFVDTSNLYNKKELVYENKSCVYNNIIYKLKTDDDILNIIKIGRSFGYKLISSSDNYLSNCEYITFETERENDSYEFNIINNTDNINHFKENLGSEEASLVHIYGDYNEKYLLVNELNKLGYYLSGKIPPIDLYNSKKELVYENNIIKFIEYKKGNN